MPESEGAWRCPHERWQRFCEEHWSWLCSAGQGKCQMERFCPLAGVAPTEPKEERDGE